MMAELFGVDLGRGPFTADRLEVAALQIATALAQLRAPLLRLDAEVQAHADFVRELADRLGPDWQAALMIDVGWEAVDEIATSVFVPTGTYSLLDCWLADVVGGGLTGSLPTSVTWTQGTVLRTVVDRKRYVVLTDRWGCATAKVVYTSYGTWYWAISRQGRVYYSTDLEFT